MSKCPRGTFWVLIISMALTISGKTAGFYCPEMYFSPFSRGSEGRKRGNTEIVSFSLFWSKRQHPYSGAAGTCVLFPLLSCGHWQIRDDTLFCMYDPLNLPRRRKEAEDVSGREQDKNRPLSGQIPPFIHSSIHPLALCPFTFFPHSLQDSWLRRALISFVYNPSFTRTYVCQRTL